MFLEPCRIQKSQMKKNKAETHPKESTVATQINLTINIVYIIYRDLSEEFTSSGFTELMIMSLCVPLGFVYVYRR